ncbi:MAG: hypothetical protein Tsb0026_18160 [Sulfuricaulis sp.]
MRRYLSFSAFFTLLFLSACASNSTSPASVNLSQNEALILGQDFSDLFAFLTPLGMKKRIQIVQVDAVPVAKENMYSLKVTPGQHKLSLNCHLLLDNSVNVRNSVELSITTESGKAYQLDAALTQGRGCMVAVR